MARLLMTASIFLNAACCCAQEFAFVRCAETNRHISLAKQDDHLVVHFHMRAENAAGETIYVRQRSGILSHGLADGSEVASTYKRSVASNNELYSVYLRTPLYPTPDSQNAAVYQLEIGIFDSTELNEYQSPALLYSWKIKRSPSGGLSADDEIVERLPFPLRTYRVVGNSIKIEKAYGASEPVREDISFGFSDLDIRRIDGERAFRKIN